MSKEPGRSRGYALLVFADFNSLEKPPALFSFRSMSGDHPETVELFQFLEAESVAYQGS